MTMTRTGSKTYPVPVFRFHVDIPGGAQAAFAECSGLEVETEVFEYQEGGVNDFVHRLPGRTKVTDITLKRGMTNSRDLWDWYAKTVNGKVERKDISIILLGQDGKQVMRWNIAKAYPIKWSGPTVKADDHSIAIEQLKLAHRGLRVA